MDPEDSRKLTWGRNWFADIGHDQTNPATLMLFFTFWSNLYIAGADLVNLRDRMNAKQAGQTEYFARMDLIGRMIPVMVGAVEELREVGADNDEIVRFLRATIEEMGG